MKTFAGLNKLTFLCFSAVLFCTPALNAQTSSGDLGIGFILGEPTGLSAKMWTGGNNALDAGLSWSFGSNSALHFHADYLIHRFDLIHVDSGRLPFYYGIGGRVRLQENALGESRNRIGVRIPVGLSYDFPNDPLEVFFEIVPVLDLAPSTNFGGGGGIGMRYYFGKS